MFFESCGVIGNPVRIRNDAVTVYGNGLRSHWETGKGSAAMNEVRRPASAGNLKPAAHRLIFLRVYPRRDFFAARCCWLES